VPNKIRTSKPKQSIDMHTHAGSAFGNRVILTFDLRVNACRATVMHCVCLVMLARADFLLAPNERTDTLDDGRELSQMVSTSSATTTHEAVFAGGRSDDNCVTRIVVEMASLSLGELTVRRVGMSAS